MASELPETVRAVLVRAMDEAHAMGHPAVGTEHLLLGLLRDEVGIPGRVMADLGLTIEPVRDAVRARLAAASGISGDLRIPLSAEAIKVVESATNIACVRDEPVGPEHLGLAMMRWGDDGASQVLVALDFDPARVRDEIKLRAIPESGQPAAAGTRQPHYRRLRDPSGS